MPVLLVGVVLALILPASLSGQTPDLAAEIDRRTAAVMPRVLEWRRDIHENPELSNREVRTGRLVAEHLRSLGLEVEDFARLTRSVLDVARTHAQGRLVSCLEGGYNLDALAQSVQAHLEVLLNEG